MLAIAALAVLAAILVIALGGSGRSTPRRAAGVQPRSPTVVALASGYLHVPAADVRRRLRSGETLAQIAAATKGSSRRGLIESIYKARAAAIRARHLPAAREAAELRALRHELTVQVDHARRRSALVRAAAAYLGLSEAQLSTKLGGGHTLAGLAETTPGHSRAGLLKALVATRRQAIERAVHEKALSETAARRALARLGRRAERLIEQPGG